MAVWAAASSTSAQLLSISQQGLAPPVLEEVDQATRAHLEQAQLLISAEQWAEAVQTLRHVMESDGERLIAAADAADAPFVRYVTVRHYGQSLLARWATSAPEALRRYRAELDPLAATWLEQARASHDEQLLKRLVEQLFTTSAADEALLLLGEYALERGEYHVARGYWERISPVLRTLPGPGAAAGRPLWLSLPQSTESPTASLEAFTERAPVSISWLAFPDTDLPLADVRARLVLVSLFERSFERAERELALLEQLHPDATGTIGGRSGKYVDLLRDVLSRAREWPHAKPSENWPTFAGNNRRSEIASAPIDIGGQPLWRVPLPPIDVRNEVLAANRLRTAEWNDAVLGYFPIVVNEQVYIALRDRVHGLDLRSGRGLFSSSGRADADGRQLPGLLFETSVRRSNLPVPQLGVPRYTLSSDGRRLFARIGLPYTRRAQATRFIDEAGGIIVGLDLEAQGRLLPGFPLQPESSAWSFEGTPVCDDRHVYVAMKRQDEVRVESYVACYDSIGGQALWRRLICASETLGQGSFEEITHNLLTLHDGTLFYNTNLGVVAALNASDGRIRWLMSYPRAAGTGQLDQFGQSHFLRSLNPAVAHKDVIVCAPSDCDRIFAIDAVGGQLLWTTPPGVATDVVHLLGVGHDHLVASGEALYWLDVFRGEMRGQFPEPFRDAVGHARPPERACGRGLLAGEYVYWPTHDRIYVFDQRPVHSATGWMPRAARAPIDLRLHKATGGNLIPAGELLLIARVDELVAFSPWGPIGNQ